MLPAVLACCFMHRTDVECTDTILPVTYTKFTGMMEVGDTLYVGRYLVSGADSASLYLEVRSFLDIPCLRSLKDMFLSSSATLYVTYCFLCIYQSTKMQYSTD